MLNNRNDMNNILCRPDSLFNKNRKTMRTVECYNKGQGAMEYLVLLAFSIIIFSIVAYYASEQVTIVNKQQKLEQAKLAVKEIADAATEVYQQGAGARKIVNVAFPEGVSGDGIIINNSIHIVFEGSDIVYPLSFPISGSIPTTAGSHDISFVSYGNSVSIGVAEFSVSPSSISFSTCSNSSEQILTQTLTVENKMNTTNQINTTVTWSNSGSTLTSSENSFILNVSETKNVTVYLNISPNTVGQFNGNIEFLSSGYSFIVPVYLNSQACGVSSNVSYILIDTYKDSVYSQPVDAFNVANVTITTANWLPNSWITIDLKYNNSISMTGYPKSVQVNDSGGYSEIWKASGPLGNYTIYVNDSTRITNTTFVLVCS
jgi:uncharacterized protein (UPF0333 family)